MGEWIALNTVHEQTVGRVSRAIAAGTLPPPAASLLRLLHAETYRLLPTTSRSGSSGPRRDRDGDGAGVGGRVGTTYLMRQSSALGGGSSEMSRNIISERLLGMPREPATDRDIPFNQVKRGRV